MLRLDLDAGLFVPVEGLVRGLPGERGTEVGYLLPSRNVTVVDREGGLRGAAEELDGEVERLVRDVGAV